MTAAPRPAASTRSSAARVLIVEDEAGLAAVLADNLRDEGLAVSTAPDGVTGEQMWADERPDLVVLDVMLPRLDGFALCERMRDAGYDTPVLYLSARGEADDRVRGLRVGGDDYLPKPFHLPEFLLRVKALLRRRGWARRSAARRLPLRRPLRRLPLLDRRAGRRRARAAGRARAGHLPGAGRARR